MISIIDLCDLLPSSHEHLEKECVTTAEFPEGGDLYKVDFYYDGDLVCPYVLSLR